MHRILSPAFGAIFILIGSISYADLQQEYQQQQGRATYGAILQIPGCSSESAAAECKLAIESTKIAASDVVSAEIVQIECDINVSAEPTMPMIYLKLKSGTIVSYADYGPPQYYGDPACKPVGSSGNQFTPVN